MSYASVAAKGPIQSLDEKCAPAPLEIEHSESITSNTLVDVDTDSVHVVPADFSTQPMQTETQATRIEQEFVLEDACAQGEYEQAKKMAKMADHERQTARNAKTGETADQGVDGHSPIGLGNGVAVTMLGCALGLGAYKRFATGELSWRVVGIWTGVVGVLCVVDFYFLRWILPYRRN